MNDTNPGKVLYVVYVPQSNRAPHIASDKKFYKRFNFQSVPMEEYEVRDSANRGGAPNLQFHCSFENKEQVFSTNFTEGNPYSSQVELVLCVTNESPIPAEYTVVQLGIDSRVNTLSAGSFSSTGTFTIEKDEHHILFNEFSKNFSLPHHMPFFGGIKFNICEGKVLISFPQQEGIYYIFWKL